MTRGEFQARLSAATKLLLDFTQTLVRNKLSRNVRYIIRPNQPTASDHLTPFELDKLEELNGYENQLLDRDEVIELLFESGKVPLWINTEVYRSSMRKTVVILICSRRFREDEDLFHKIDQFPPFHILVPTPTWQKEGEKFDINWQHQKVRNKWRRWKNRKQYQNSPRKANGNL